MTELEYVEVEGFKGLEYVEFEPTNINLITGRNNTGKTSFLEATNLLFDPFEVTEFRENLDKLVNVEFEESSIRCRTATEDVGLRIRYPNEEEANDYFASVLAELISSSVGWHLDDGEGLIDSRDDPPDWISSEKFDVKLTEVARQTVDENEISNLKSRCVILELESNVYPCVYFGNLQTELLSSGLTKLKDTLESEFDDLQRVESSLGEFQTSNGAAQARLMFRQDRVPVTTVFLKEIPSRDVVKFITSQESIPDLRNVDREENGLKIDDIGDYVREGALVDDLKTFTLDYLIYEEDGEKYDIPFEFMGDGFKSVVGLLWELMDDEVEDRIVLLEEPENHMHPGYIREVVHFLIDLARDEDVQFFITTHDHDFITDFVMEMPDEKREYLEDEFSLVKMDDFGADVMEYEEAEHHLKDLHLDLRGI